MNRQTTYVSLVPICLVFIGLPLLFYLTGGFPRRTVLKETFSIVTIVACCLGLAQLFLIRGSNFFSNGCQQVKTIKLHIVCGYLVVGFLLVHPIFLVVPRYFESGVDGKDAFITIVTSFGSRGIVLGLISWCLMFILAITSFLRHHLPLTYKKWKTAHGMLAILFIALASWHAIDLGRHTDLLFSIYMIALLLWGVLVWIKS